MRVLIAAFLTLLTFNLSFAAGGNAVIGSMTVKALLSHHPEFSDNYDRFKLTETSKNNLKTLKDKEQVQVDILFGTWCHDSQREVPRMIKLLETAQISFQLIGISMDKQEPKQWVSANNLKFTPTFIVKSKGKEVGRIIEKPKETLEKDLLTILSTK